MLEYRQPPEVHGHRGCRGLLPENTIPAFKEAVEMGCDWLEMDVVISGDGQVVVSHEPWMDRSICLDHQGDSIPEGADRELNIFKMNMAQIEKFDCGSRPHPAFPDQKQRKATKPRLVDVVEKVEEHVLFMGGRHVDFNIEIKSRPEWYGIYQPEPARFVELVLATIDTLAIGDRCMIQSFDIAVLEAVHAQDDDIPVALLVEESAGVEADLAMLSFTPDVYSPTLELVDETLVKYLRERDIGIAVWTVDREEDMIRMIALGVDGIITDRPDRLVRLLEKE